MNARMLELLIIDDEFSKVDVQGTLFHFFNQHVINGWMRAQEYLIGDGFLPIPRPDLIIADVSMQKDDTLNFARARGDTRRPLAPVGLMFALPFLHSRTIVALMPYSQYFTHGALNEDPTFLVTMGLVAAKTLRMVHRVKDQHSSTGAGKRIKHEAVNETRDVLATIQDLQKANITRPATALRKALVDYRDRLSEAIKDGTVRVSNISQIAEYADSLKTARSKDAKGYVPLADTAALDLISPFGWDRIQLRSLFADMVTAPSGAKISCDAADELETFCEQAWGADPVYQMAVTAIREQCQRESEEVGSVDRPRIDNVIRELFADASAETKGDILRLCVLFANVHAWAVNVEKKSLRRKDVYCRLGGEGLDAHTYESWFGQRMPARRSTRQKRGSESATPRDIAILKRFGNVEQGRDGCFLIQQSLPLDDVDVARVRTYLCEFDPLEAYAGDSQDIVSHCIPFPIGG